MILDLTHTIREDMPVYPGSPQPSFKPTGNLTRNGYRETLIQFASHTGTHMDAPSHMLPHGSSLFYTGWEKKWGTDAYFDDTFPVPDKEAAQYLVSCGLKGVGTDALSVDTLMDPERKAHKTLLGGGLVIVESLCLKKVVGRKDMMFFALPMKFMDADGAPVRAVAEFRDFSEKEEGADA